MHDLLQELGKLILMRQSPGEPGNRSRLWKEEEVRQVLIENTGSEVVEGIIIDHYLFHENEVHLSAKAFSLMTNLRMLKIGNVQLPEGLEYLSNKLRLLDWHRYPLQSLPSNLQLDKTVEFKMCYSRIKELWKGIKPLNMLKVMKLRHSENLIKTPDFTEAPNLEELDLEGCIRLREIHSSLLLHNKLILLNLKGCKSLTTLPGKIFMKSLKTLVLSGCLKLRKFPHVAGSMECLRELLLDKTDIKEMPLSIELLSGLVQLTLKGCKNLVRLPSNINSLKSLKTLNLLGCFKFENLLETVGQVESLEELDISGTAIRCPPSSIFLMKNLKTLSFRGCNGPPSSASCYLPFPINLMRRSSDLGALMLPSLSGALKLRKSSCTIIDFVDSLKLLGKNGLAISMLREFLEVVSAPSHKFSIVVPGSEIPKWFMYQNEGSSITVTRPSYLCNMNQVVGYAACRVFHVPKHSTGIRRFYRYPHPAHVLHCSMDGYNVSHFIYFGEKFGHRGSDHLWLLYLPRQSYYCNVKWHFESNHFRLSFMDEREKHCPAGSGTGLKVKRCGFHPGYMHEVEEFDETTKQWTRFTSYNLNEFHHDFVGSNMAVAKANGSGCCDDYDEEPQPNRFRQLE
ncbi:Disease resistance-like protein DSC1 [Citrus sinensis]|uniref:Disease resistance-like protein DSC1 n=1 Tax=Citrus sinensis TaxID=2711 RepID=A0ACB8M9D0_CITSI|nr:Disease resistance-like protein DSC1 [Citrus sinensis]